MELKTIKIASPLAACQFNNLSSVFLSFHFDDLQIRFFSYPRSQSNKTFYGLNINFVLNSKVSHFNLLSVYPILRNCEIFAKNKFYWIGSRTLNKVSMMLPCKRTLLKLLFFRKNEEKFDFQCQGFRNNDSLDVKRLKIVRKKFRF